MATLTINFTPATPAPANGYRVKYRSVVAAGDYTEVVPAPTSSPVVITGLTGFAYEGTIEANCGGGNYGNAQTFSAVVPLACGQTRSESYGGLFQYTFPLIPLNLSNALTGNTITINYNVSVRPNKITVKNITDSTIAAATGGTNGWVGQANYSGPWGASLSTSLTGTLTFVYDSAKTYNIEVECGATNLANPANDTFSLTVDCGASTTTTTTTTTTSTSTTTTTAGTSVQYYGLTKCVSDGNTYYTTTPISTQGLVVTFGTTYYKYNSGLNIVSATPPANFIGNVTLTGSTSCPTLYYGLTKCPSDGFTWYTSTNPVSSGQRVQSLTFFYVHNTSLNLSSQTEPPRFIGPVTIVAGNGCPP